MVGDRELDIQCKLKILFTERIFNVYVFVQLALLLKAIYLRAMELPNPPYPHENRIFFLGYYILMMSFAVLLNSTFFLQDLLHKFSYYSL